MSCTLWVIYHVLRKPREARSALLWILFVMIFPVGGFLLYLLFGINTIPKKEWAKEYSDKTYQKRQRNLSRSPLQPLAETYRKRATFCLSPQDTAYPDFNKILDHLAKEHPLLSGNEIKILEPATLALEEMFAAIQRAQKNIHLLTYIFNDDSIGRRLMDLLVERARAGVEVKVLYDTFGSAGARFRRFFLRHRGIQNLELVGFSQSNIFKQRFQLNLRNHRKLLIIDGLLGFTGGCNFHDTYLPQPDGSPGITDLHFKVEGPLVTEMQYTFLRDWYYMSDQPPEAFLQKKYFPDVLNAGTIAARLQNSGPVRDESTAALNTFFAAINQARKQIVLVTPYFVPPDDITLALRQAAYRGVDVKVLVPSKNNHPTIKLASHALYRKLLLAGVRIFERHPPFIHTKAAIIDDVISIIGSANLDPRSLELNYETNILVFNSKFANQLKASVLDDFADADEIQYSQWRLRPQSVQLVENFFNLFHPIA